MKCGFIFKFFLGLHLLVQVLTQGYCGTFTPLVPTDCTRLNNIGYNCCFISGRIMTGTIINICTGIPTWKAEIFMEDKDKMSTYLPDFYGMVYNMDTLDCGNKVTNAITEKMICGTNDLIFKGDYSECYASGPHCCILFYHNLAICIDTKMIDPIISQIDRKEDLMCLNHSTHLHLSLMLIVVLISLII